MFGRLRHMYRKWRDERRLSGKPAQAVFSDIYRRNLWGNAESVSGGGSTLAATAGIRAALPGILQSCGVQHLLDLPCGDFHWMQAVDMQGIRYTGADIVPELVAQNQAKYGREGREFRLLNILEDPLPQADLVLVRDCLVHFSKEDLLRAAENLRRSGIPWLLTTHFPHILHNADILTGQWRMLNVCLPPLSFPEPLGSWTEITVRDQGQVLEKQLVLIRLNA